MQEDNSKKSLPLSSIALVLGIFCTASLATLAINNLIKHEEETYASEVTLVKDILTQRLSAIEEVLHSVKVLFDASNHVDANEFRVLSEDALSRHKYIKNFQYMPLVTSKQRDEFEQKMRDEGYFTYSITERENGQYLTSTQKERYFPIIYQEPFTPASAASLGFDLLSETKNEAYLMQAIDSSESVIFPTDNTNSKLTNTLIKPLYAGKDTPKTISDRRHTVNGLIALVIDNKKIIDDIPLAENMALRLENIPPLLSQNKEVMLEHTQPITGSRNFSSAFTLSNQSYFTISSLKFELNINKHLAWKDTNYGQVIATGIAGIVITCLLLLLAKSVKSKAEDLQRRNLEIKDLVDQRTRELALEKDRAHITLASISDGVITTNADGIVEYLNPAAEKITGWNQENAAQKPIDEIFIVINEKTKQTQANPVHECLTSNKIVTLPEHSALINHTNQIQAIEASAAPISDDNKNQTGTVLVFHDVSQARKMAQQMTYQATHDALTSLPNRTLLMDRLKQAISRAPWNKKFIAVLFLDLDRFKLVNDTLGHDVGDELLCQVADRMKACIRDGDTISRLGGDEFVVVLTDLAAAEDTPKIAQKFIDALAAPFVLDNQELFITTSIGIGIYPNHGNNPFTLMKNADTAMYQAKSSGRNNFILYDADMSSLDEKRLSLETDLRRALERNELELYYQPQIDIEAGQIIGAEALLR